MDRLDPQRSKPATAHNRFRGLQRFFNWYATKDDAFLSPTHKLRSRLPMLLPRVMTLDALGPEDRAVETADNAVWLVGIGLLAPGWIAEALAHNESFAERWDEQRARLTGTGRCLAGALRTLLAADGQWKVVA